jgi:putative tryptophan/tyrosine transport system substrate-binding protein
VSRIVDTKLLRSLIVLLGLTFASLAVPLLLRAAQFPAKKIPHVGFLSPSWPGRPHSHSYDAELLRLLKLSGTVVGRDISISFRFAEGHDDQLDGLAAELIRERPDVVIAVNPSAALAAHKATQTIPIIFVAISDPVRMGLVASLVHPGGNITGTANMPADLNQKRLELLKDALPSVRRVAILARTGNPGHQDHLADEVAGANRLGFGARAYNVIGPEEFETAFQAMDRDGAEAVLMMQDGVFFHARQLLLEIALRHRIAVIADARVYAQDGALLAYGIASYAELVPAVIADLKMILNGANPGDIPIDQPMNIGLAVNLATAKKLGVAIPRSLLVRANEVIE